MASNKRAELAPRYSDAVAKFDFNTLAWYRPGLSRHEAVALLEDFSDGVYLLRPRGDGGSAAYSLDVKWSTGVKHFEVLVKEKGVQLGHKSFPSVRVFESFLEGQPSIQYNKNPEKMVTFRAPITREQHEIQSQEIYANDGLHYSIGGGGSLSPSSSGEDEDVEEERHVACVGPEAGDADNQFSKDPAATCTVQKEGYLTKRGGRIKSWKTRWFVLCDGKIRYFDSAKSKLPIKTLTLDQLVDVYPCTVNDRDCVFSLVFPWRTFCIQAPSRELRQEWLDVIKTVRASSGGH